MQKSLIVVGLLWSLCACTFSSALGRANPQRPLIEPTERDHSQQLTQALSIVHKDEAHQLLGVIELTPNKTAMAVFTPEGLKLFSVVQNADGLAIETHPMLPEFVNPRQMLADAQLVNWPIAALRTALSGPWRVEQTSTARRLWWHDRLILEAIYQDSIVEWQTVELSSPRTDYRLMIRAVSKEDFD